MPLTKNEVFMKHFGVSDRPAASDMIYADNFIQSPPLSEWSTLQLPYTAPTHPPIPSIEQIDQANKDSSLRRFGFYEVCRIGDCVVKRSSHEVILQEAENILFLEQNSQVRTAKVYAVFRHPDTNTGKIENYLVSEYIHGETMTEELFKSLSVTDRSIFCSRLGEQLKLLRSVPPPQPEYYGRIYRQGFHYHLNLLDLRNQSMWGPYNTYEQLTFAMYDAAELREAILLNTPEFLPDQVEFLAEFKSIINISKGRKPLLTHLDLKWENIIVQPVKENGEVIDWKVVVIDWDSMGWLPAFMQEASLNERIAMEDKDARSIFIEQMSNLFEVHYKEEFEFFANAEDYTFV